MKRVEKSLGKVHKPLCCATLALSLLLALPNAFAQGNSAKNAKDDLFQDSILVGKGAWGDIYVRRGSDIFANGFILPMNRFLVSYRSEEKDEKNTAFAFLLGVADATEGKKWCSYGNYKPVTVFDAVNEGVRNLKPSRYDERAAYVITEMLVKKYPCRKGETLANSFIPNDSIQEVKDDPFQKSILTGGGFTSEQKRQGEDIFVPNLPLSSFLGSRSIEDSEERNAAYAFLLGVADVTEGSAWCSYRRFKTTTLLEEIHIGLKKLNLSRYDERAAYVITEIFESNLRCQKEH
ncbi:MAG: hypothetical protein FWG26_03440 [Betaproteobacteria bacterium]|jgi:hypothetical protein|nr:hypothetical protein [Betaproteobacteria bacterium]